MSPCLARSGRTSGNVCRSLIRTQAEQVWAPVAAASYSVGAGAVDPEGIGEGASLEPFVLGGFLFADFLAAGVGDGLLVAAVLVLVWVVPDCSQDARNAMPIKTAISENRCLFIGYSGES